MKRNTITWVIVGIYLIVGIPFVMLTIFGCGAPLRTVWPTQDIATSYVTGEEVVVTTGSPFLWIYTVDLIPAYRPRYLWQPPPAKSSGDYSLPEISPSQTWDVEGKDKDGFIRISCKNWRPSSDTKYKYRAWAIDIREDGFVPEDVKLYDPSGSHKDNLKWNLPDRRLFEKFTLREQAQYKGFKIELIYNGISKNTIRVTYREFAGDMARPAFYQDSTYDLDQSKEIHFKSIRMKILEADNSKIRLVVLDDGGIPWFPRPK